MQLRKFFCALALCLAQAAIAGEVNTIDLKPFVGYSPFNIIKADWLLPRGQHVYDGVPWKIDGAILLYGGNFVQKSKPARTNVNDIPVGQKFEVLHLLAATQQNANDEVTIAKIHLNYADGTEAALDIKFGEQIRNYIGPWHAKDKPLKNKNVHQAWHTQFGPSANHDQYLRLFHVPLTNPNPAKEVRTISLESTKRNAALMVVAMTVGPANVAPLPNDSLGHAPFPDLRPRSGEPATGEGFVYTPDGQPINNAIIKVVAARNYNSRNPNEKDITTETTTDDHGHFALQNLPDDNAYRVLIAAKGYEPYVYHGIDAKSDPVQVRLELATNRIGKFAARARLVDLDGKPIRYAIVARHIVGYGGDMSWEDSDFPEYALTDTNGEFVFSRDREFDRVQVTITSGGLAPFHGWVPATNTISTLDMGPGVTLHGRVLNQSGKPLPNIELGITGTDRNSETFAGTYHTTTDSQGVFEFKHVMPHVSWNLYGTLNSCKKFGALPARKITSGKHGDTSELGDLSIVPALRLSGEVKTRHGEALPKNLKLYLGTADHADSESSTIDKDGKFEFTGLYAQVVTIHLEQDNWKISGLHRSLSFYNPWELIGMLEKDKTNLTIMIEQGKREYAYDNDNGSMPGKDTPESNEIGGVENLEATAIVLSGSIFDDQTGRPIRKCKIIPGYKPSAAAWGMSTTQPQKNVFQKLLQPLAKKQHNWWDKPFWMPNRTEQVTNGTFSIPFVPLQSTPMLRVEADGYEPLITDPIPASTDKMVIRLNHGVGPSGIVYLPDGKPAAKAQVLFATGSEQYQIDGRMLDFNNDEPNHMATTASDGTFAFRPLNNPARLYFAAPSGYAEESLKENDQKIEAHLKPWALLTGTLINSNGTPAAGVVLGLTLYDGTGYDNSQPLLHYNVRSKTDTRGTFLFTNVPPRRVQVERIVPSARGGGWTSVLQTWTEVEPGVTNDLGKITYDHPPAKSVVEQLKEKMGL